MHKLFRWCQCAPPSGMVPWTHTNLSPSPNSTSVGYSGLNTAQQRDTQTKEYAILVGIGRNYCQMMRRKIYLSISPVINILPSVHVLCRMCQRLWYLSDNDIAVCTSIAINKWVQYVLWHLQTQHCQHVCDAAVDKLFLRRAMLRYEMLF